MATRPTGASHVFLVPLQGNVFQHAPLQGNCFNVHPCRVRASGGSIFGKMKQDPRLDWPAGYGRRVLASVDSTNAEAARIAPGLRGPEWILALAQTAARGRRGRPWINPAGNFAATLVMRPAESPDRVALRSFVAAVALWDTLVAATGRAGAFSLKWPNDVLLNGGKLAGILLESAGAGRSLSHFAIGIGVNLRNAPETTAVEAGMAREDVDRLTSLFEEVRYGGESPTEEREEQALEALRRIEDEYAGDGR